MTSWPDGRRAAVAFTFDFDAEEVWIGEDPDNADRPGILSQGTYGAKVAVPLILDLLERNGVRASFFIPGRVAERHPGWGANQRSFTSLSLEPLPGEAVDALLRGLVPGLPDEAVARIRERADGIPLYAVETVRTLLDRGLLEPAEGGYRVVGELGPLDVPETLHALIASRLDGLSADERRVLQDAAVLGKTFSPRERIPTSGQANHPQLAIDSADRLAVTWDESGSGSRTLAAAIGRIEDGDRVQFTRATATGPIGTYPDLVAVAPGTFLRAATTAGSGPSQIRLDRIQ